MMQPKEMAQKIGSGLLSFPVTHFDAQLAFAEGEYRRHCAWLLQRPIAGLFAAGGTGEFFSLTPAEVARVVSAAATETAGRVPVIAGCGYGTAIAVELAQSAERAGADGLLLLPPYLINSSQEGLAAHIDAVCRATALGVIVYNRDNAIVDEHTLARLCERHPNLVGYKDGVGDIELMMRIRSRLGDRLTYIGGLPTAETFAPAYLEMGVNTYSSAIFNFMPDWALAFYRAVRERDEATVQAGLRDFVLPYIALRNRGRGYAVAIVKAGMRAIGRPAGTVRPPLTELLPEEQQQLTALIQQQALGQPAPRTAPARREALVSMSLAVALLASFPGMTQTPAAQTSAAKAYVRPASFPNEDRAAVAAALSRARKIAADDLFSDFIHRCIISPKYNTRVRGIQHDGFMEPTRMFDNLYSVGQNSVSAFALVTSDGIVLIDTLNNEDEAQTILVPNLQAAGLDPKAIKYIVISHGHGDHYGGAAYLARTYGARVLSSKIDWDAMDAQRNRPAGQFAAPPIRDMEIADGQSLTIGDTTLRFYVTPGHTNGTLSMIFPVREAGRTHTVGFFGGTGGGGGAANLRNQVTSIERWMPLARQARVDVLVANHPLHDRGIENNEILRYRLPGESNPYVIGADRYQRYFAVQQECARVQLARLGERAP